MPQSTAIRLHANDDVVISTQQLMPGNRVEAENLAIHDLIPPGHKVATRDIKAGEAVRRYNQIIGFAKADIGIGKHVHSQNLAVAEFAREHSFCADRHDTPKLSQPACSWATNGATVRPARATTSP